MKIFKSIKKYAYQILILVALSICESYYILTTVFAVEDSFLWVSFAVFAFVALGLLVLALPKKLSIPVFIAMGLSIVYLLYEFFEPVSELVVSSIHAAFQASYIHVADPAILVFSLSFIVLILNMLMIVLSKMKTIAAVLSVTMVCLLYFTYDKINLFFFSFYLMTLLLVFIRSIAPQIYEDDRLSGSYLVSYAVIVVIALIIAPLTIFMSNLNPEPLKWIDDLNWFESDEPGTYVKPIIRIDGQSKLTHLSQDFTYSDDRMMTVISPYADRLRNKTYDLYDGSTWQKAIEDNPTVATTESDYYDMIALLNDAGIEYSLFDMEVHLIAQSKIVFAPMNSHVISTLNERLKENYYGDLYSDETLVEGTIYTMDAINIEYKSKEFIDLIKNSSSQNIDNIENYLGVPESLMQTLGPIAQELTKDGQNNYEKAKIIESYLSSQFEYNLEPPEKPANIDFVEYFLFEAKEGFCTHYATSMVMMLRSIDIPCRYVTGYLLIPPDPKAIIPGVDMEDLTFTEGVPYEFDVLKQNSHAWVEVWFDDYGWLPFEPTSRYESVLSFGYSDLQDYNFDNIQTNAPTQEEDSTRTLFIILAAIFVSVIILVTVVRIYIVSKRTNQVKLVHVFKNIKRSYYISRKELMRNETATEFCKRTDENNNDLQQAVNLYEYSLFSGQPTSQMHLDEMKQLYKKIRKRKSE